MYACLRQYPDGQEENAGVGGGGLLQLLMENKGCILPRNRLLEKLWDVEGNFVNDNTLTVAMKRLREKLHHEPCITTVRGIGYRMEETE